MSRKFLLEIIFCIILTASLIISLFFSARYYSDLLIVDDALSRVFSLGEKGYFSHEHYEIKNNNTAATTIIIVFKNMSQNTLNKRSIFIEVNSKGEKKCLPRDDGNQVPDHFLPRECRMNKIKMLPELVFRS